MQKNAPHSDIRSFADSLRQYLRLIVTTHHLPDGDGLGSQMALTLALREMGKQVFAINSSETPEKFSLVDPENQIQIYRSGEDLPQVDAVVVVDTSDLKMLGPLERAVSGLRVPVLFIDHHIVRNGQLTAGTRHLIDESYSSTGELTFALLQTMGAQLNLPIAVGLYVALVTDTESFRFRRTSSRSHLTAARLLETGVQPEAVYRKIYANESPAKIQLLGHVLETSSFSRDGRIGWLVVRRPDREGYGATVEDTESFVSHLTLIKGVEVALSFREEDDGRIKVSLRGNGQIPVFEVAHHFGGGGHRYSAGMRISGPLEEAMPAVLAEVERVIRSSDTE